LRLALIGNNRRVGAEKRDYYEVLGISREADERTIRLAFHSLAREWHPDIAHKAEAELRFRELAEAYSVLSKHETRVMYDRYGYRGRGNQAGHRSGGEAPSTSTRRRDVHLDLYLRSFEAEDGARPVVEFRADGLCPECLASGDTAGCTRCDGTGVLEAERRLRVRVPPGLEDGAQLRVAGEGHQVGRDSAAGDLLIKVHVLPAPRDRRWVRYVALILLVVATVVLAVYLTR